MDSIRLAKGTKPIPGGSNEEEYRKVMHKIMEGLTTDNLDTILFLCKDHIPHGREINSPLQFLKFLEDRDHVSQDSVVFIAEALHIIRRIDLLKMIPCIKNKKHFETDFLAFTYSWFSSYRVLTVKLQDELTERDFETFRYQCSNHLNVRVLDSATNVLSLLKKLEEEDVISSENYEDLLTILESIENVKPLKMFQRLLDGDETVAVPVDKKKTSPRYDTQETVFAGRNHVTNPSQLRSDWSDRDTRVETTPIENPPPPYSIPYTGCGPIDPTSHHQTEAKYHDEKYPVVYDFDAVNNAVFARSSSNSKWFPSEESIPKIVSGAPSRFEYQPSELRTIQPQHGYNPYGNQRVSESRTSGYGAVAPSHHHEDPHFYSIHRASSYPQHHHGQGRIRPQDLHYSRPIQQQMSSDASAVQHFPHQNMRHVSYPNYSMPPHLISPPEGKQIFLPEMESKMNGISASMPPYLMSPPEGELNCVPEIESQMHSLSTSDVDANASGGSFIQEDTPQDKATSSLEAAEDNPKHEKGPGPEHEKQMDELRKRNEELVNYIKEYRNVGSYKMDSSPVGLCVLINNLNFVKNRKEQEHTRRVELNKNINNPLKKRQLPRIDLSDRIGSNVDADKVEKLFECFNFSVKRHDDLDQRGILKVIREASHADHTNYDCFILIVLSHGDNGCVFGIDGFPVRIYEMQNYFLPNNCSSLTDKPKILIIQACQGGSEMTSFAQPVADVSHDGPLPGNMLDESTPSKADFLIAYSTVPGYKSYRSRETGTHYMQEIVRIFKKNYEHQDLLSMMIMVNNEVTKYLHKQVPMPVPTLRKKVFFHLKEGCVLDLEDDEIEQAAECEPGPSMKYNSIDVSLEEQGSTQVSGDQSM